jgi:hypothetical protein
VQQDSPKQSPRNNEAAIPYKSTSRNAGGSRRACDTLIASGESLWMMFGDRSGGSRGTLRQRIRVQA